MENYKYKKQYLFESPSSTPLPPWEGVLNPKPNNMDLVLFVRDKHQKGKLKLAIGALHRQSIEEILITLFRFIPDKHQIAIHERDNQNIYFIDKTMLGYAKGYACSSAFRRSDSLSIESQYADMHFDRFNSLIVEQDEYVWQGIKIASKTMPVLDDFCLLTKCTKLIEPSEIVNHLEVNCSFDL